MARLLWLADTLRAAGLSVHEVDGWKTRGADTYGPVYGVTIHETQGSTTSTDAGEIRVLLTGSESADPPIAQLYLSRTGNWHVVASGTCFHNKVGWAGPNIGLGNDSLLGIEAQHAQGEPWTATQYRSYVAGTAALVRKLGCSVSRVAGHKEHQPGAKTDPGFDMNVFRRDVAAAMAGEVMSELEHWAKNTHAGLFLGGPSCGKKVAPREGYASTGNAVFDKLDHLISELADIKTTLAKPVPVQMVPEDRDAIAALIAAKLPIPVTPEEFRGLVDERLNQARLTTT